MKIANVMTMNTIITITSKGQTTLPVAFRRKLGVPKAGGRLQVHFDEQKNEIVLSKPLSIEELSQQISRYIKPGTKPLIDIRGYIQKHRKVDKDGYL